MINPCRDYCYVNFGKEYSAECNDTCAYAQEAVRRQELEETLRSTMKELDDLIKQYKDALKEVGQLKEEN